MEAEEKWQMYLKESNELKLKLSQLTDDSELKQEIRKKDELIKRLNQGLRTLYEDMEKKSSAMRDQESELQKRADQLKALAAMKNSSVGSPSLTRTTSVTQVVSNRIDPRLFVQIVIVAG
jgi:stress response protein YsnF